MKCVKGYEVQPLRSAAGYYMGTLDDEGFPNCRLSSGYAKTAEKAKELPLDRQGGYMAPENEFCNGCGRCFATNGYKRP